MSTDLSSPLIQKLLGFLSSGVPPAAAASAAGVDPSYVSQLLDNESFRLALYEKSAERLEQDVKHDSRIESVEAKALAAIEQKLPFIRSAMEAAKIFQILNNSKKRAMTKNAAPESGLGSVTIVLPRAIATSLDLRVNTQQQVIEVAGRTMAPLPSKNLPEILAARQKQIAADSQRAEQVLENVNPLSTVIGGVVRVL